MAKKMKIEIDFDRDNSIIGISCHRKDYWLAYKINEALKIKLKRTDDIAIYNDKQDKIIHYPLYFFHDFDHQINFYLLTNNHPEAKLFPSQKATDFFLLINGPATQKFVREKVLKIKAVPNVLMAFEINLSKIKLIDNFLEELELHMLEIGKTGK